MKTSDVENVILSLAASAEKLDRSQLKQLFRILIAVGQFPVCPACHQPITDIDEFTWDHIYPRAKGGSDNLSNLQPMHRVCNEQKGSKIQKEYFDCECEITTEIKIEIIERCERRKKKKRRNVAHLKPWQLANNNQRNGR